MKKLINKPNDVVEELLKGLVASNPSLELIEEERVIIRRDKKNKVAIISGGGSGHEPSHAGLVGEGLLDGAVCGEVFTSPTPFQVLKAIEVANQGKGVLLVVKNYTGDVLNFEMAKDMAKDQNIEVEMVVVDDDIAVENSEYTVGKRGVAGTVLIHKIAGALAEKGEELKNIKNIVEKAIKQVATMGVAFEACIVPQSGKKSFILKEDEVEVGLGIHAEAGIHREKIKTAKEYAEFLVDKITKAIGIQAKDKVAVLVNGLGGTPLMELYIMNGDVAKILEQKNIQIVKILVGSYMTSLEMAGFSLTLMKVDDELERLLKAKANSSFYKEI